MSKKVGTYRVTIPFRATPEISYLGNEINRILTLLEDRLDVKDVLRGSSFSTTQNWEKEFE